MQLPDIKERALYNAKLVMSKYKNFYDYIMSLYSDSPEYNEKLYRYLHNIENRPICPVCGNPIPYRNSPAGYGKYCSRRCMALSVDRIKQISTTKEKKYGVPHYNNPDKTTETMNMKYGGRGLASKILMEKSKQTCIEKYGVDNVFKLQEVQDKCCSSKLEKYGDLHYSNREKNKQTCIDRYGVDNPMRCKEIQEKVINTMLNRYGVKYAMLNKELANKLSKSLVDAHRNGKYDMSGREKTPSKIERDFQQYLIDNNIKYIFQYRSDLYPYLCDFYIPDYDLYIEIQGTWTHGKHPYTGTEEDLNIINDWKNKNSEFYNQAIYVWSELDVKKREIAKINNLNFLEIFSIDVSECISLFQNKIQEITHG